MTSSSPADRRSQPPRIAGLRHKRERAVVADAETGWTRRQTRQVVKDEDGITSPLEAGDVEGHRKERVAKARQEAA